MCCDNHYSEFRRRNHSTEPRERVRNAPVFAPGDLKWISPGLSEGRDPDPPGVQMNVKVDEYMTPFATIYIGLWLPSAISFSSINGRQIYGEASATPLTQRPLLLWLYIFLQHTFVLSG